MTGDSLTDSLTAPEQPAQEALRMGLENHWPGHTGSRVRIPPPPLRSADSASYVGIPEQASYCVAMHSASVHTAGNRRSWWATRSRLAHGCLATAACVALGFTPMTASAAPCASHTAYTKVTKAECIKAHKQQATRDRMAYPPRPTWAEAMKRLTPYEQATILRIGRCEMGEQRNDVKAWGKHGPKAGPWARLRWGLNLPRYSTAFGIWNGNGHYIRRTTTYAFPGRTPAEEVLGVIALAKGPARGFSGWGCF